MSPLERIRLEKAAVDCGFERTPVLTADGALELRSAHFPEVVLLRSAGALGFQVDVSVPALLDQAGKCTLLVEGIEGLYRVLQCWRRPNFDHPCRLNFDQGREAVDMTAICG